MKYLSILLMLFCGCASITLKKGDVKATYWRFWNQEIGEFSLELPDGYGAKLINQKAISDDMAKMLINYLSRP